MPVKPRRGHSPSAAHKTWPEVVSGLIFWAAIVAIAFTCCRCTPIRPPVASPAVDVRVRASAVCTGVRVEPMLLATARHCTEHGWALRVDGAPATFEYALSSDVAFLRVIRGPHVPVAPYAGERFVRVRDFAGDRVVRVLRASPVTGLELDGECVHGESGAPVTTDRGVVAVVTNGAPGMPCFAQWVRP